MLYRKNWPTVLAYGLSVVLFFVLAGYAVLYGTGYRITWHDLSLVKTGVLAVSTRPGAATVTLDGRKLSRTTPVTLRNLLPGTYRLKVELAGYRDFDATLAIESGEVTEIHNVDLVLDEIVPSPLIEPIKSLAVSGNTALYIDDTGQLWKMTDGLSSAFKTDKLSDTIRQQIASLTAIDFAKRYQDSSTWAILGVTGTKRTLFIIDDDGYRGLTFGTPYNAVESDNLIWIANDRPAVLVGNTLTTLDLTLNKTSVYAKEVTSAAYLNGHLVYVIRTKSGQADSFRDNNPFDEKPAELYRGNLPVGTSYDLSMTDNRLVAVVENNKVKGLWIEGYKKDDADNFVFLKIGTDVKGLAIDRVEGAIYYITGSELRKFDTTTEKDVGLRGTGPGSSLLTKNGESLYILQRGELTIVDVRGQNLYSLIDFGKTYSWVSTNGSKIWLNSPDGIWELVVRAKQDGLFGGITRFVSLRNDTRIVTPQ